MKPILSSVLLICLCAGQASAAICDFRPSRVIGAGTKAGLAGAGTVVKTVGAYTLTNPASGASMIGSAASATASASGGAATTASAIVTAPASIVVAGVTALGAGAYEGACYFTDERVTDPEEVLAIMRSIDSRADPDWFQLSEARSADDQAAIFLRNDEGFLDRYNVADLYIVNGVLMHRKRGRNVAVGDIGVIPVAATVTEPAGD
ncbi:hypothetical protein [Jannaschia rubra]|uniref:Uncharacterized protein n=1 Tax=Jannaschia rubra TaxID=282197 RepID=A0A0M6XQ97_9RHOB|nr:hypothetical protein [Jannaschia rubra]CTQ32767.1 hypothetical protein JAN5088_01539 [Jannaschia rubra]SFF89142.1 hypothetical protein SAMN04488517_101702 [Jannaschia rubra]